MNDWPNDYPSLVSAVIKHGSEVASIGQFTPVQKRMLNRAVQKGDLSKGRRAGPFPAPKTCYAAPGFDFHSSRQASLAEIQRLAGLDARGRKGAAEMSRK